MRITGLLRSRIPPRHSHLTSGEMPKRLLRFERWRRRRARPTAHGKGMSIWEHVEAHGSQERRSHKGERQWRNSDADTLRDLRNLREVAIRTEKHPESAVVIWAMVTDDEVFVRSVRLRGPAANI
jgi:hypothetical protein